MRMGMGSITLLLATVASLVVASAALAQTGDGYDLTWNTVDGGGYAFSSGGDYTLGGTVGQPDADLLTGGDYTLSGGFWAGMGRYKVYLPLVLRNS
jgi:hypothetical protein